MHSIGLIDPLVVYKMFVKYGEGLAIREGSCICMKSGGRGRGSVGCFHGLHWWNFEHWS